MSQLPVKYTHTHTYRVENTFLYILTVEREAFKLSVFLFFPSESGGSFRLMEMF